ncbi:MAG: metal ABC transporter permease [Pseudomonadota bacterium]
MTLDDLALLAPAFAAGLLVLATHVPLGRQVLARGIIFLDLAIAQVAATGALVAGLLLEDAGTGIVQAGAGISAIIGALALYAADRRWPEIQEAVIGSTFVLAATLGLLLLAADPHGGEALRDALAGQILWITADQLPALAAVSLLVLGLRRYGRGMLAGFYLPFAIAVIASVQVVGVYLVFASLILPALAVRRFDATHGTVLALATGASGYALGLGVSYATDLPAGPACVWGLACAALVCGIALGRRTPARGR